MSAYCDHQVIDINSIAFLYDGCHLRGEQSRDKSKVQCVQLDGSMTMKERDATITRFIEDPDYWSEDEISHLEANGKRIGKTVVSDEEDFEYRRRGDMESTTSIPPPSGMFQVPPILDLLLLENNDLCEDLVLEIWVLLPNFIKLAKDVYMPDFIAASDCKLGELSRPGGPLASQLAKHPVILKVNDWFFCHGGLLPHHAVYGIEMLNKEVPTWMRGLSESDDHQKLPFIATRGYDSVVEPNPCSSATRLSGLVAGKEDNLRHSRDRKQTTGLFTATREEYYLLDSVEPDPVGFRNQVFVKANKSRAYFKRFHIKFKRRRGKHSLTVIIYILIMLVIQQATGVDYSVELAESRRPFRALLDAGLLKTTIGNRVFGALKGALDGGLDIPHTEK
ncbi:hypothetical protein AgCh_001645 [Apium graveolens]